MRVANPGYDLVCGQGRLEAYVALGRREIPAIIVEIPREERLLRSLVENMARRLPPPLALMSEIQRLKAQGYTNLEIGKKLDIADTTLKGLLALKKAGEERLLNAAVNERIPLGIAMDIARTDTPEMQRELLKAYESKQLNGISIRTLKRIMDQREFAGKQSGANPNPRKTRTSAESLINVYRRESQKQKLDDQEGQGLRGQTDVHRNGPAKAGCGRQLRDPPQSRVHRPDAE